MKLEGSGPRPAPRARRGSFGRVLLLLSVLLALACADAKRPRPSGQFGVFYGAQIQERSELALESLREGQLGFRVSLPPGYVGARRVLAQITRPGPLGRRVTEHLDFEVPPGRSELSERVSVPVGAVGVWNVRVVVGETLAIDRAVLVQRRASG